MDFFLPECYASRHNFGLRFQFNIKEFNLSVDNTQPSRVSSGGFTGTLMASVMASRDVTISHNEDELLVTLTNSNVLNGLDLADPSHSPNEPPPSYSDMVSNPSSSTIKSSRSSGGRFLVQPASTDSSLLYKVHTGQHTVVQAKPKDTNIPKDNGGSAVVFASKSRPVMDSPDTIGMADTLRAAMNDLPDELASKSETEKKRVSFPEGQALIKGFAHAPNPWYNGPFISFL